MVHFIPKTDDIPTVVRGEFFKHHVRTLYYHPGGSVRDATVPFGRIWRAIIAEFFGIAIFVYFATGAATVATIVDPTKTSVAIIIVSLGQAFALVIALFSIGNVSGGVINPAVTIALVIVDRLDLLRAALYIIAQIGGAIIGSLLLKATIPGHFEGALGATTPGPFTSKGTAVLIEIILTFTLTWVIFATAIDPDGFGKLAPLAIGLVLIGDLIVGWLFTGSSMNPARSLGPAIVANVWRARWVYWVGPIVGAVTAAVIYDFVLMSRPPNPSPQLQGTRIESQVTPQQVEDGSGLGPNAGFVESKLQQPGH